MNDRQRSYLVSTAEDFYYAHVGDANSIAMSVIMTAQGHNIDISEYEVVDILMDAKMNYARGKRTRGGIFGWTGV